MGNGLLITYRFEKKRRVINQENEHGEKAKYLSQDTFTSKCLYLLLCQKERKIKIAEV